MQKNKMGVCWVLMILLGCRLSHAIQPQSPCNCQEDMKTICVPGRDKVQVPCPNAPADEMNFHLYKNQEVISNITCKRENNTLQCSKPHALVDSKVDNNKQHALVSFILTRVRDSNNETYRCEGVFKFPPPLTKKNLITQVLEEEHLCKCNNNKSSCCDNPMFGYTWIWIPVVVLLILYSVIITIIATVNWIKLKKTDSQNDYINTKPRVPRERRKKKGVQNPLPRYC